MNQYQQNMRVGSGLTRFRSAPSSYFSSFLNNTTTTTTDGGFGADDFAELFNARASSPETQRIFARFMNSSGTVRENSSANITMQSQSQSQLKNEPETEQPQQQLQRHKSNDYSSLMYQSSGAVNSAVGSSYDRILSSNHGSEMKMGGGGGGLVRHSSSPAGLFDNIINIESEFGAMRRIGNFGAGIMPPISEIQNKSVEGNNPDDGKIGEDHDFLTDPWDDSAILSDDFLKGLTETENKPFIKAEAPDNQNNEGGNRSAAPLSHHLSLPKSPAMKKLLQDSVPCKIRAKRGCATHPRSIAERVRRTKISERMRKLQELVPNMEKQTNTADMLDLAVDYIKDLQGRVKTLSDNHAKCSCSAKTK